MQGALSGDTLRQSLAVTCIVRLGHEGGQVVRDGSMGNLNTDKGGREGAMDESRKGHKADPDNPNRTLFLAGGIVDQHEYAEVETLLSPLLQKRNLPPLRKATVLLSL